ncbi:hypothetical protein OROGR_025871 [Orobanche gracilis]
MKTVRAWPKADNIILISGCGGLLESQHLLPPCQPALGSIRRRFTPHHLLSSVSLNSVNFLASHPARNPQTIAYFSAAGAALLPLMTITPQSGSRTRVSVMLFPLFQEMGLNARQSGSILNSNAALRIIPYESIRNRIRFLQSAGVIGLALSRLIVKHPDILTSEEIDELSCFIIDDTSLELRGKINQSQIERLLTAKNPGFLVGFENKVWLLLQLGIWKD